MRPVLLSLLLLCSARGVESDSYCSAERDSPGCKQDHAKMMRAVRVAAFGAPQVLRVESIPRPQPAKGQGERKEG